MFLDFASFYRKIIKNTIKIAMQFILIFQIISNNIWGIQVNENKKNQDEPDIANYDSIDESIKDLLTIKILIKFTKIGFN